MQDFCAFLEGSHRASVHSCPEQQSDTTSHKYLQPAYKFNTLEVHENHPAHLCNTTYSY